MDKIGILVFGLYNIHTFIHNFEYISLNFRFLSSAENLLILNLYFHLPSEWWTSNSNDLIKNERNAQKLFRPELPLCLFSFLNSDTRHSFSSARLVPPSRFKTHSMLFSSLPSSSSFSDTSSDHQLRWTFIFHCTENPKRRNTLTCSCVSYQRLPIYPANVHSN